MSSFAFAQRRSAAGGPDDLQMGVGPEPQAEAPGARPPPLRPGEKQNGVDPVEIARATTRIFQAMEGIGTDERAVFAALQNRSPEEIAALRASYEKRYGKPLDAALAKELNDDEMAAARAALEGDKVGAAAATLVAAVSGLGSDADIVNDTLRAIPDPEQRKAVAEEFKRRTGKSIGEMLDDELGGKNREQAQLLMQGKRAEAEAVRLEAAMEGAGTNEAEVFAALQGAKTREERDAIVAAYQARTGRSLDADLLDELGGREMEMAGSLSVGDLIGAKVAEARLAMEGPGTNENLLRDAFEGSSVGQADALRAGFAEGGGASLDAALAGELSGSEKLEIGTMLPRATGPAFGSPEFDKLLDETTGSKAREGNQVDMLFDGKTSFPERFKMIDEAKDSINLQTFIFNSDGTGWAMATKLAEKARQGVKVRVLYDAVGSNRADPKMLDMMREAGVELREYGNLFEHPLEANKREHEKQLIIDGQQSIQGGMNIADEYALGGSGSLVASRGNAQAWRDVDIKLQGPSVQDAQTAFLKQWNDHGEDVPKDEQEKMMQSPAAQEGGGGSSVRVVQHRPEQDADNHIENLYLNCIRSAQTSITIENAYLIPSEQMRAELIAAAKRGVKVRIMTNSAESNDNKAVAAVSRGMYDDLVTAGVEIVEKQGGTLHAKTAAFDGAYSIVGSANLNSRSREHDAEIVLAVSDPSVAQQIEQRFEKGLSETEEVTMKELAAEGIGENAKQKILSLASGVM